MNSATQRPVKRVTPDPVYGVMWYEYQIHDCWGAQHGCAPYQYIGDDGRYYQNVWYMDGSIGDPDIVIHGPAPKSWVDNPDSYPIDPYGLVAAP